VWIADSFEASVLLETDKKYQAVELVGISPIGSSLVLENYLPEVVVSLTNKEFTGNEKNMLENNYNNFVNSGGYKIYTLKDKK
jgi:hypothetical protein